MENNPSHIAIILDGNRRFAKRLMLEPWKGHEYGRKKVEDIIRYASSLKIKQLTFYALSQENMKSRPRNELEYLFRLFKEVFSTMDRKEIKKKSIKFRFLGDLNLLPLELKKECLKLEKETKHNSKLIVNIAMAYGGRQEIILAIKKIIKNKIPENRVTEKIIEKYLYLSSKPDLIIRTGGEKRLSNFLPFQSTYSELIFIDKMWPEFTKEDLIHCIQEFQSRKRRFGK
ncbi:di-trans,poly-cis-decaprenylcistransferase [Candidatus Pacearchaeota archaeon]|nr:di-trans,poly-cis-decaprenylcistransferase [Candidatus Pacearchaeota archaeon]